MMSPKLLNALDNFRDLLERPIYVSPAPGATYRSDSSTSMHSFGKAVDIFPKCDMFQAFTNVLQVPDIMGIGLYPHWRYGKLNWGMHIDVREAVDKVIWWQNKDKEYFTIYTMQGFQRCIDEYC